MPNQDVLNPRVKGTGFGFRSFRAILAQAGTAAPTATIIDNTLADQSVQTPTLGRTGVGVYTITFPNPVLSGNVIIHSDVDGGATAMYSKATKTSTTVITVSTFNAAGAAADLVGNLTLRAEVWPT